MEWIVALLPQYQIRDNILTVAEEVNSAFKIAVVDVSSNND